MSRYTILLALLHLVFSVQAQTNTFVGSSPGVWHEARNWSLKQIPTASHDAVIQSKEVIVESNHSAVAKSVLVDGRSYLEVQNAASLSIDNSSAIGLHNMGKTLIDGRLTVENVAGTSTFNNHCILNEGIFSIGAAGRVHLEDSGGCGLTVSDAGELENSGEIWVYGTNTGIRVRGLLENHNFIYVEPDQSHGIELRGGKVKNASHAELRIEGSHFALLLFEDVVTGEQSLFENFGLVRAERMDWWGVSVMDGEFYNYRGAQVKTMYSQQGSGVSLGPDGKFLNYSSIETRYNLLDGVFLQGEFQNHGNLFSSHNGRYGLFLLTISGFNQPGLFENHNDVEIFDNDSASIQCNTAFYHNMDDGITVHYNILRGDSMRNDGIWESFAPDIVHSASLTNHGVILDYYDAHGLTNNQQLIVDPVDGPLVQGVAINQALELVSTSNISIFHWYKRFYGGLRIGSYNVGLNRFTPNARGDGEDMVYVDVRINSSGQRRRIMAMVDETTPLNRYNGPYATYSASVKGVEESNEVNCIVYTLDGVIVQQGTQASGIPNWSVLPEGRYSCTCKSSDGSVEHQRRWIR